MSVCAWGLSLVDAAVANAVRFIFDLEGDTIGNRVNNESELGRFGSLMPAGQLGILSVRDALRLAGERQLDLVEVAPNAVPPVCRIMDYGKHKYEQSKREKVAKEAESHHHQGSADEPQD